MGGLGFIHLGFLAASAAVAVPIVIHLLFRQRARRVEIGTIHFLRVVLQDQARRRKIRRWLLLALRTAGVLLLALLFARPFWRAPETLGSEREAVVLIDRSASMAAGPRGPLLSTRPSGRPTELIAGSACGIRRSRLAYFDSDGVAAGTRTKDRPGNAPGPGRHRLHQGAGLGPRHHRRVAAAEAAGVSFDRPSALRNRTAAGGCLSGRHGNRGCRCRPSADDEPGRRGRAGRTDRAQGRQAARSSRPAFTTRAFFPLATSASASPSSGKPPIEKTVSIDGHSRQLVRFEAPVNEPGLYHGFVEVAAGDDLPFDNRRWLAFQARVPDRVLLIDGRAWAIGVRQRDILPRNGPAAQAARRSGARHHQVPIEPTRVPWGGPGSSLPDLTPFHVVILCNVPDVSDCRRAARLLASSNRAET